MTLKTRRILYTICIIIFFLSAPPLVLYTAGFRYDFSSQNIVETGSLVVKSYPEDARVFLDGMEHIQSTPTIINNILPGKINLEVRKEGFHQWHKEIYVGARVTTFEDDVRLFPVEQPYPIISARVTDYWWNTKRDKIAYATDSGELRLYNTLNSADTLIANIGIDAPRLAWSPHNDSFLFKRRDASGDDYYVVNTAQVITFISLRTITLAPVEQAQWDPQTANTVYALSGDALVRIPYLIKTVRVLHSGPIDAYMVEPSRIVVLEHAPDTSVAMVSWMHPSDPQTVHRVSEREYSPEDELIGTNSHRIAVFNRATGALSIYDPSISDPRTAGKETLIRTVEEMLWSADGATLIHTDGYSLYQRSFNAPLTVLPVYDESRAIIRYTEPLKNIAWTENEQHIFFTVGESIRVIERTIRQLPHIVRLAENIGSASHLRFATKVDIITYIADEGKLHGLSIDPEKRAAFLFGN